MKKVNILTLSFIFIFHAGCVKNAQRTLRVSGAWALFPLMNVWAEEYHKVSDVRIEVTGGGAGKGMSEVLTGQVDISMCSRPLRKEEIDQGAFYVSVTKDAVIGTINSKNPVLADILKTGLSRQDIRRIFTGEIRNWGELYGKYIEGADIVIFGRSDASGAAKIWAEYLGNYTQTELQMCANANFDGDQQLAHAVINEENSIGFNNLNYVYSIETGGFIDGIRAIPLDLNDNNLLEKEESFYERRKELVENVSDGIYPSPPSRFEYVVSRDPFSGISKEFLVWILTEGQKYVSTNGYVTLSDKTLKEELEKIKCN